MGGGDEERSGFEMECFVFNIFFKRVDGKMIPLSEGKEIRLIKIPCESEETVDSADKHKGRKRN